MVIYSSREEKGRGACTSSRDVIFVSLSRHRIRPSHNEIIWRRRRRRRQIAFCDDSRHYIYQISVAIKKLDRTESTAGAERERERESNHGLVLVHQSLSAGWYRGRQVVGLPYSASIYDVSTEHKICGQIVNRFCGYRKRG